MQRLFLVILVIGVVGCATSQPAPSAPTVTSESGKSCIRSCQQTYATCVSGCNISVGANSRANCVDNSCNVDGGVPVKDLCRRHGFSEASYYLWRSKFGGMDVSDAKRLKALETENGRAMLTWAHRQGIALRLIEPGKPNQHAYVAFNGRLRDECLNEHWFTSLAHANSVIECWRREYNEERPKKSLGGLTPAAYAMQLAARPLQCPANSNANRY